MRLSHRSAFLVALAVGVAARAALLLHPVAATDVTYYNAQASSYLLRGVDPYGASYSVPAQLATPGARDVFTYLPGVFAFLVPGGPAALVVCDVAVGAGLYLLPARNRALWGSAFLLFPPFVLFSTSFPNDILPAIAFAVLAIAFEERRMPIPGALLWGLAFASSQAAWFVFPFYALRMLKTKGYLPVLLSLLVAGAVLLPFLAWDPQAFLRDAVLFQLGRPAAPFLAPGPFGVNVNPSLLGIFASFGATAPLPLRGGIAALILALLLLRSGSTNSSLAVRGAAFAAAALWLLSADFFVSYSEFPVALLLVWAALRGAPLGTGSSLKEPPRG